MKDILSNHNSRDGNWARRLFSRRQHETKFPSSITVIPQWTKLDAYGLPDEGQSTRDAPDLPSPPNDLTLLAPFPESHSDYILTPEGRRPTGFDHLCHRCANILLLITKIPDDARSVIKVGISGAERVLQRGIQKGCQLCAMIRSSTDVFETLECLDLFMIFPSANEVHSLLAAYSGSSGDLVASVSPDDPAAGLLPRRSPLLNLGSEEAFVQSRKWLDDCRTTHGAKCRSSKSTLPLRLVKVGTEEIEPTVFETSPCMSGQYAVLSYCWGSRKQPILTKDLVDSGNLTFPIQELPPTIVDALKICRRLGLPYLWVDALCIIQDSPDAHDWVEQSAVMDDIYGNATITLAAAASPSVWDGILVDTKEPPSGSCRIPFNVERWTPGESTKKITVRNSKPEFRFYPYSIDAEQPLSSRAWAFQEHVMSKRILSYQKEQLVWQCKTGKYYKDGPVNIDQIQVEKSWQECITQYSKCSLTVENDRLMAISGYARSKFKDQQSHSLSKNRYLAGLWENELVDHLLWISKAASCDPRPASYRAPTWSWASIDGPVEFVEQERKGSMDRSIIVLSASLSTSRLNPFGTLEASPPSFLHVKGFLKAVCEIQIPSQETGLPTQKSFRLGIGKNWAIMFDIIDVEERMDRSVTDFEDSLDPNFQHRSLYSLQLTEFTALLLIPTSFKEGRMSFERVGIVKHWHREEWHWFDDVTERTEIYLM